jgi:hypothetical protein
LCGFDVLNGYCGRFMAKLADEDRLSEPCQTLGSTKLNKRLRHSTRSPFPPCCPMYQMQYTKSALGEAL